MSCKAVVGARRFTVEPGRCFDLIETVGKLAELQELNSFTYGLSIRRLNKKKIV